MFKNRKARIFLSVLFSILLIAQNVQFGLAAKTATLKLKTTEINASVIDDSKNINPPAAYLESILSNFKNHVTNSREVSYNHEEIEGRSSNLSFWDSILNFMNKTKDRRQSASGQLKITKV